MGRAKGIPKAALSRLARLKVCPTSQTDKYARELRKLAEEALDPDTADKAAKIFKALADPTRLKMLKLLKNRPLCVCEIMIALGLSQPTTSYHLSILESAGLLTKKRQRKWMYYKLATQEPIKILERIISKT